MISSTIMLPDQGDTQLKCLLNPKPECLTHPLVTTGLDSLFGSYLTPKNREALARVNRVCQDAIEKHETWDQSMTRSRLKFLAADPSGKLSLTDKKCFL